MRTGRAGWQGLTRIDSTAGEPELLRRAPSGERRALLQLAKEFERRAKVAWAARAVSHSARYRSGAWTQAAAMAREAAAGLS